MSKSAGSLSLVAYPAAPNFNARAAICASSCIDSTRIAGGLFKARMRGIASSPLTPGMEMSSSTTSHGTWRRVSSNCSPLLASPTTRRSLARPINCLIPSRTMVWSSATSTRITDNASSKSQRHPHTQDRAFARHTVHRQRPAHHQYPLTHAHQSEGCRPAGGGNKPLAIIADAQAQRMRFNTQG